MSSYLEPESMSSKKISPTGCNCRMIFVASCGGLLPVTSFCIFLFDCKGVPVFLCYLRNAICTVWVLMHWLHWCFFKNLAPFFFYFMRQILIKKSLRNTSNRTSWWLKVHWFRGLRLLNLWNLLFLFFKLYFWRKEQYFKNTSLPHSVFHWCQIPHFVDKFLTKTALQAP